MALLFHLLMCSWVDSCYVPRRGIEPVALAREDWALTNRAPHQGCLSASQRVSVALQTQTFYSWKPEILLVDLFLVLAVLCTCVVLSAFLFLFLFFPPWFDQQLV